MFVDKHMEQKERKSSCEIRFNERRKNNLTALQVSPPLKEPEVPTGYATPEFGQQIIQNGTLYSNLQQQEDQLALNQSIQGTAYEQPSASAIEQAVPITVKALTPFPDQPVVVVLSDDVRNSLLSRYMNH